ncbi:hypothetical protein LLEC1_04271 [Akanthomyces lecanii]|uniref:Uncharacterized protein n=1 Tax=Cordyceps confragosa TaxID=2714763 RepID=A0A179IVV0_CORDF|nr:hypothetical protein LLEC1_04271 [Akanthomyces lecanii]
MELPKITRLLWWYLTILLAFGQVLVAQLPKVEPAIPKDGLQIRLERELFVKQRSVIYASHLEFDEKPKISDRQLLKIAIDAFNEMRHMVFENRLGKFNIPRVMTTLLVDREIIFASSAKGSNEPIKDDGQVQDDLAACGQGSTNKHRNKGRCGEIMAFHEYYESRVDPKKLGKDSGARIVAITTPWEADLATAQPEVLAPCGSGDRWGCNRLVKDLNVLDNAKVAADPEVADFDYKKLRKEGKLKSVKTKFEEGNGSPPADKPSGFRKKGPPKNNLPARPDGKLSTPADTGHTKDTGDSEHIEVDASGKKRGPPKNNLPPRPPKERPSTPVESGDSGYSDGEVDHGTHKTPPHRKPPPRPHRRARAPPPAQDGEESGHEEPRDTDKVESSAGKRLPDEAPRRHESRRYF